MFEFRAKPKAISSANALQPKQRAAAALKDPLTLEKLYMRQQEEKIKAEFLSK